MQESLKILAILFFLIVASPFCRAQCLHDEAVCRQAVPHFVKFDGSLKHAAGAVSEHAVPIIFSIYREANGGTPLWQETQNVQLDSQGHYEVMLGASADLGIPLELFAAGEPRWLGVQVLVPGESEQPRVMMVSVPYALEAGDAQTLGGLPASAFAKVSSSSSSSNSSSTVVPSSSAQNTAAASSASTAPTGSAIIAAPNSGVVPVHSFDTVPKFSTGGILVDSQIVDTNGAVGLRNLGNILFADRFANGVPDAVAACPADGCIIYAVSPNVNLNLGNIDPGTKAITIYLGPYTFTVNQIVLRKAMKIIGMGAAPGPSPLCNTQTPCNGTNLQSVGGNNPVFIIPQTNNTPASNVLLTGFRVLGSAGNTSQDGFLLDTSSSANSGLWFSTLDDIYLEGFSGIPLHIKGRPNDYAAATQWVLFNNVIAFRNRGGGNALRLEGATFELRFRECQFDGQAIGDGTNIYIGGASNGQSAYPIGIVFESLISQAAAVAVQFDGAYHVIFQGSHHEKLWGVYQIINNTNIGTHGLTITDSYFSGDTMINSGKGFALSIGTAFAEGIIFAHNELYGNPDSVITGTNLQSVIYRDNLYAGSLNGPPTSGVTPQINPADSINIHGVHTVALNGSATPITTIQSGLGPGETVTFYAFGGPVTFAPGGNIDLMGSGPLTVTGTITFVRTDLGAVLWRPVSQWNPPAAPAATAQVQSRTQSAFRGSKFDN